MSRGQGTALRTAAQSALIDLRAQLHMSQQDLSAALGTTVRSVARWETASFPHGRIVKRLEQFATKRGLTEHAAQFRRLLRQEQFLNANRKFFLTVEGLDLQVAIAKVRQSRKDPKVAHHWANVLKNLGAAVSRVYDLPKSDGTEVWEVEELFDLMERLQEYAKQARKVAAGHLRPTKAHKESQERTITQRRKQT
jgi:transcriptional regulator with XRE-family HTH domain